MMRYLCLVHADLAMMAALDPGALRELTRRSLAHDDALKAMGHFLAASARQDPVTATIVRVRDGEVSMTDGPYVEGKEDLGGFIFIEARDHAEAVAIAQNVPMAAYGTIEVRAELELEARVEGMTAAGPLKHTWSAR
jgi:hypothetical protein